MVVTQNRGRKSPPVQTVGGRVAVQPRYQFRQRHAFASNGAQAGLKRCHQERGRHAFSGHVRNHHHQPIALLIGIKCVVIIAGYRILRTRRKSNVGSRDLRWFGRHKPHLNLARDFQVALHGHFVSEFQREQQQEEQGRNPYEIHVKGKISAELELESRHHQHNQRDEQKDPPRRRHLHQHGPEQRFRDVEEAVNAVAPSQLLLVRLFHVKAVAGSRVGGELRPQFVDLPALAEALPETPYGLAAPVTWLGRRNIWSWRWACAHGIPIRRLEYRPSKEVMLETQAFEGLTLVLALALELR